MAEFYRDRVVGRAGVAQAEIDQGLRSYMLSVYNYMTSGVLLTGIAAYLLAETGLRDVFFGTFATATGHVVFRPNLLGMIAMFAPLGIALLFGFRIQRMSMAAAQGLFWAFAAIMGISIASILLNFTGESVARVFFISAASFAGLSLWGYTTRRSLSGFGSFLIMGLIGILVASIVNIFLASSALHFAISVIGVLVFAGLTAYDTQRIKEVYSSSYDGETVGKLAITGALTLYLDFINLFMMLIQLFGQQRD
jgi:FtsH-binding integral membrane protein